MGSELHPGHSSPDRDGVDSIALGRKDQEQAPREKISASGQLGDVANAAWQCPAALPGVGLLLPTWRQIAMLLAPCLHQVRPSHAIILTVNLTDSFVRQVPLPQRWQQL